MKLNHQKKLKSSKVQDLQLAEAEGKTQEVQKLSVEVAKLEGDIAAEYIKQGKTTEAVINLISQASCLSTAGKNAEAIEVFSHARSITNSEPLKAWMVSEMFSLQERISHESERIDEKK